MTVKKNIKQEKFHALLSTFYYLLSQAKGLRRSPPTEHILCGMIYKKIKSIGKRYGHYGHYGHPSAIVHYLLPIIAIQGPWGRLERIDNILILAILETPSYGQTMASMAGSMAGRNVIDYCPNTKRTVLFCQLRKIGQVLEQDEPESVGIFV